MLAKDNRSVAGAGRGVALPCHAGAVAVAVRRAGIAAAATAHARKVGGTIRIVLATSREHLAESIAARRTARLDAVRAESVVRRWLAGRATLDARQVGAQIRDLTGEPIDQFVLIE